MEKANSKSKNPILDTKNIIVGFLYFLFFLFVKFLFDIISSVTDGFPDFVDKFSITIIVSLIITFIFIAIFSDEYDTSEFSMSYKIMTLGTIKFLVTFVFLSIFTVIIIWGNDNHFPESNKFEIEKEILEKLDVEYEVDKVGFLFNNGNLIKLKNNEDTYNFKLMKKHNLAVVEHNDEHFLFYVDLVEKEHLEIQQWESSNNKAQEHLEKMIE